MRKRSLAFILFLMVLFSLSFVSSAFAKGDGKHPNINMVPGEILVKPKTGKSIDSINRLVGASSISFDKRLGVHKVKLPPGSIMSQVLSLYTNNPNVEYAEPNFIAKASFVPNDTFYSSQWALPKISEPAAWDISRGSSSIIIAVIDSGVDYTHPDLFDKIVSPYNVMTQSTSLSSVIDTLGHGTHVAGIIAADVNNATGVAGVGGNVSIMPIKATNDGSLTSTDVANAIYYAVDHGARVINMSFAGYGYSYTEKDAIDYAYAHNVVVVAAAGNDGTSSPAYPAAFDSVMSVAATDQYDSDAWFSNWGSWIEISAPGVSIYSTTPTYGSTLYNTSYDYSDGTSMASPAVAGLAGLVASVKPSLTNVQIRLLIDTNPDDVDTSGYDYLTGYGRINAYKTLKAATAPPPTASAAPTGGTYSNPVSVTLSSSQYYSNIYYTTDGSDPQIYGSLYNGPIYINTSTTIKYFAYGLTGSSPVYTQTYNILPPTVSVSIAGGTYHTPQTVTLTASQQPSTIYYTVDGSTPTTSSTIYSGPIAINNATALKYFAIGPTGTSQVYTQVYSIVPIVNISPQGGTYDKPLQASLAMSSQAGKVFYTLDGTTPDINSPVYSQPININTRTIIKYLGVDEYGNYSQTYSQTFIISPTINVSPLGGVYKETQSVALTASEPATIYYTTDGSTPTTSSPVYVNPVVISKTTTLKYMAVDGAGNLSQIFSQTYTIDTVAPTVTINTLGGVYKETQSVALTASEPATIYYTTDGSTPTTSSPVYVNPVVISKTTTLKYMAVDGAGNLSPIYSQTYTIDTVAPTVTINTPGGVYKETQSVALTASEPATIYYTTDGSTPTTSSPVYVNPVVISKTTTLKYMAVDAIGNLSPIYSQIYTIDTVAPTVTINTPGGFYCTILSVSLTASEPGNIYYTVDGSQPTSVSTVYKSPINLDRNTTLKYIAIDQAGNKSPIYSQSYTIEGLIPASMRIAGANRLSTAVAISKQTFAYPKTANAVLLATGLDFPDALSGASLAKIKNAPMLLVTSFEQSQVTLNEIARVLKPGGSVYILGGNGVVSPTFATYLQGKGYVVKRLAGADRYGTAAAICKEVKVTGGGEITVVTGENFPDSLSISPYTVTNGLPMVLVNKDGIPAAFLDYIRNLQPTKVTIVGGSGVVSSSVESKLKALLPNASFRRFGGLNRYDTGAKISQGIFGTSRPALFLATGLDFPDALSGSVLAGFNNAPMLLVRPTQLPTEIVNYLTQLHGKKAVAIGGYGAISDTVYQQVLNYVQ